MTNVTDICVLQYASGSEAVPNSNEFTNWPGLIIIRAMLFVAEQANLLYYSMCMNMSHNCNIIVLKVLIFLAK